MSHAGIREEVKPELGKFQVSNKNFVRAWQQARSMPELVAAFGMTDGKHARQKIMNRADRLRGQGVRLKKLQKGAVLSREEVSELNRIIEIGEIKSGWLKSLAEKARKLIRK